MIEDTVPVGSVTIPCVLKQISRGIPCSLVRHSSPHRLYKEIRAVLFNWDGWPLTRSGLVQLGEHDLLATPTLSCVPNPVIQAILTQRLSKTIRYNLYPQNKIPTLKLVFNIFTTVSIVNIFLSVFFLELYTLQNICGTIYMTNIYTAQKPHHQSDTLKV